MSWSKALLSVLIAAVLALPVTAAPIPLEQYRDIDGKALTAEQFRNKVTVLVVADRATADVATAVGQQIRLDLGGEPRFVYAAVLNLRNLPSFTRSIVTGLIKDQTKTVEAELQARFVQTNKNLTAPGPRPALIVPDWDGSLALRLWQASPLPEFAVFSEDLQRTGRFERQKQQRTRQQLENHAHVFVLDPQGEVQAHYLDAGAAAPTITKVRALLKLASPT